jgi:hypothetical protein
MKKRIFLSTFLHGRAMLGKTNTFEVMFDEIRV